MVKIFIVNQLVTSLAEKILPTGFRKKLSLPYLCTPFKNSHRDSGGDKKNQMSKLHFTTKHANEATVQRTWYVVDGTNQTIGRMCARIAAILRGKNKAYYTPHVDTGDYIIVTNCEKVVFTGNKLEQKIYDHFSGYPGGRKEETAENLQKRRPEVLIERAVKGMLPKNRLGRQMYKKLFVYVGSEHPHTAQQPKELKF